MKRFIVLVRFCLFSSVVLNSSMLVTAEICGCARYFFSLSIVRFVHKPPLRLRFNVGGKIDDCVFHYDAALGAQCFGLDGTFASCWRN